MNTGLIIQRTHHGLEVEYNSIPNGNFENLLHDESKDALQISNRKDFYSVLINKNIKIYSLIKSVKDREGRDGFVAIHLLTSNTSQINNVVEVLKQIATKNETYFAANERRQDYSEILSTIKPEKIQNSIAVSTKLQCDIYFAEAENEHQINELLNSDRVLAAKKLYIFTKDSGYNADFAQSHFKFKPFTMMANLKTIDIPDSHLLEYIKVDDEIVRAGSSKLLISNNQTVTYKRNDEKKERTFNGTFDLQPKYVAPKREAMRSDQGRSLVPIIAVATTSLLLGGLGGHFLPKLFTKNEEVVYSEPIITSASTPLFKVDKDTKNPVFAVESGDKSTLFDMKIKFDTDKKEWKIKEPAQSDYQPLDRKLFKELLGPNADSIAYITALEQISGYELKNNSTSTKSEDSTKETSKEEKSEETQKNAEPTVATKKPAESVIKTAVSTTKANQPAQPKGNTPEKTKSATTTSGKSTNDMQKDITKGVKLN